jgi:hypothetical protein
MASGELAIPQSWHLLIMLACNLHFITSCHPSVLLSLKMDVHLSGEKARWKDGRHDRRIAGRIDVRTDFPGKFIPKLCLGEKSEQTLLQASMIACAITCGPKSVGDWPEISA